MFKKLLNLRIVLINLALTLVAFLAAFIQYWLILETTWFPGKSPISPQIILALFAVIYFAIGFWISDFKDARVRRKEKNWSGKLDPKVVDFKQRIRAIFWGSSIYVILVYVISSFFVN